MTIRELQAWRDEIRFGALLFCLFFVSLGLIFLFGGIAAGEILLGVSLALYLSVEGIFYYLGLRDVDPVHACLGTENLVGRVAIAKTDLSPQGHVLINGELWEAISAQPIFCGAEVEVLAVEGLQLRVSAKGRTNGALRTGL